MSLIINVSGLGHKMRKAIIKWRGFEVTKQELIADIIFLFVALALSLILMFIFDIHWSLYPDNVLIPPSKWVGIKQQTYLIGTLAGGIIGFILIKLFLIGVRKEELRWLRKNKK